MAKQFLVFVENDEIDGFKIMEALKKIKGYHHVQEITQTAGGTTSRAADGLDSWGNLGKCTICGKAWQECSCLARR